MPNFNKIDPSFWQNVHTQDFGCQLDCLVWYNKDQDIKGGLSKSKKGYDFPFICAYGMTASRQDIFSLSDKKGVKYISPAKKVLTTMDTTKACVQSQFAYNMGLFGKNITVAVIDTGCDMHLDLVLGHNRIIKFVDFINNKTISYDDHGHGTFVCGVLAGSGLCSNKRLSGIAPWCNLVVLKSLNEMGETQAFTILNAMQWIIDHKQEYNIKIACMSFGSEPLQNYDPLVIGAEVLWDNGIVVVCASGNDGTIENSVKSPAISPKVLSVGSCSCKMPFFESEFSSHGVYDGIIKPEVLAPGENVVSLGTKNQIYNTMSGTSVATPTVAGMIALLLEKNQNLTPSQLKNIVLSSCTTNNKNPQNIVNVANALKLFN
ncbi:MAG: S8 family peptidase [Clostridia bacterium]|nr:S8 family peptidase [Clostridia bacterium]